MSFKIWIISLFLDYGNRQLIIQIIPVKKLFTSSEEFIQILLVPKLINDVSEEMFLDYGK